MIRILLLGASLFLSACSDQENVHDFIQEVKTAKARPVAAIPEIKVIVHSSYNASNLRSPFVSGDMMLNKFITMVRPDQDRKKQALEKFKLDDLVMVGTLGNGESKWALVMDHNGVVHHVEPGNYIGEHSGLIEDITDNEIKIKELVTDDNGQWIYKHEFLRMLDKKLEKK